MAAKRNPGLEVCLERSCEDGSARHSGGWLRTGPPVAGLERIEAFFRGRAYSPHRHDTYAIGHTIAGVQCFDYRGEGRHSRPGDVFVLHPDELHDGHAGTDAGFRYRILYIEPALICEALAGKAMPFVTEAVSADVRLRSAIQAALVDCLDPLEDLRRQEIVSSVAEALDAASNANRRRPPAIDTPAISRTREYLIAHLDRAVASADLEKVAGLDRWSLARQFRRACGTSPHRYFVMRRLDHARSRILAGSPLAEAAIAAGFADQSHMTRQFKQAYGLPPGQWAALNRAEPATTPPNQPIAH